MFSQRLPDAIDGIFSVIEPVIALQLVFLSSFQLLVYFFSLSLFFRLVLLLILVQLTIVLFTMLSLRFQLRIDEIIHFFFVRFDCLSRCILLSLLGISFIFLRSLLGILSFFLRFLFCLPFLAFFEGFYLFLCLNHLLSQRHIVFCRLLLLKWLISILGLLSLWLIFFLRRIESLLANFIEYRLFTVVRSELNKL